MLIANRRKVGDGLDHTCFVVGKHDSNDTCCRTNATRQIDQRNDAVCINRSATDRERNSAAKSIYAGDFVRKRCDAGVFNRGNDELSAAPWQAGVIGPLPKATDCEVVGLSAPACENDTIGGRRAEEHSDSVAGVFQDSPGASAEFVLAGGVEVRLAPAGAHRFDDLRENGRRGVVVEVDSLGSAGRHRSMIPQRAVVTQKCATPLGETAIAGGKKRPV